jgi:multidrug efflux pump subunit AcrB
MDYAYIEVNEKMDKLLPSLPADMARPHIYRINTSDIPVMRIQVVPKSDGDYAEITEFAENVLVRRLEQIPGVSIVDINGNTKKMFTVSPRYDMLKAMDLEENDLSAAIQVSNADVGGLSVRKGDLRFFVNINNRLRDGNSIGDIPVRLKNGGVVALHELAAIGEEAENLTGMHLYKNTRGLVITVQKQSKSRLTELEPKIREAIHQFQADYPALNFYISQDQSYLLNAGVDNLYQDMIYGGILTIALLFLLLGNWTAAVVMSISIPASLIITVIFFDLFQLSFNIISLSGLALGVGMLIDNSIVVIDNIFRTKKSGIGLLESCVEGTSAVVTPVISQVLTTVAVYLPLILLNGIASPLVMDQSAGLTICLSVSLLVAFVLSPVLVRLLAGRSTKNRKEDTVVYKWISRGYHKMISHILRHRLPFFLVTIAIMPIGFLLFAKIPINSLPQFEKQDVLLKVDWSVPVALSENSRRVTNLVDSVAPLLIESEADIGIKDFLLNSEANGIEKAEIYFKTKDPKSIAVLQKRLSALLHNQYPKATFVFVDAANAFSQLFISSKPYLEARFLQSQSYAGDLNGSVDSILKRLAPWNAQPGLGLINDESVAIRFNDDKLNAYGVSRSTVEAAISHLLGNDAISSIRAGHLSRKIGFKGKANSVDDLMALTVKGTSSIYYPIGTFLTVEVSAQPKFITAGMAGEYQSVWFDENNFPAKKMIQETKKNAALEQIPVEFQGRYFDDIAQVGQLSRIVMLVILILYVILVVQYENFILPLIVMLTIPLGISGGIGLLWLSGGTLNVMSLTGLVVILGLIVDDPILKIEILKRLEAEYRAKGEITNTVLTEMIHKAGEQCLKPLLLVSLTTSLALIPVLFIGGFGNELQKPMAVVIIGGLSIGTFFTTWFIPVAYGYYIQLQPKIKSFLWAGKKS